MQVSRGKGAAGIAIAIRDNRLLHPAEGGIPDITPTLPGK